MSTIVTRFLSFEETLGASLVKVAYFVLLAVLVVLTGLAMIGGVVTAVTADVWAGIGQVLLAPIRFAVALILLRVGAELILAVLSIDDQLAEERRRDAGLFGRRAVSDGSAATAAASTGSAAPVPVPAPAPRKAATKSASKAGTKKSASKATKKTAKKAARGSASSAAKASAASGSRAASSASTSEPAPSASAKRTAAAAKAATRPSATDSENDADEDGTP